MGGSQEVLDAGQGIDVPEPVPGDAAEGYVHPIYVRGVGGRVRAGVTRRGAELQIPEEPVRTRAALQDVVPAPAFQDVGPGAAHEEIRPRIAGQRVIVIRTGQVLDPGQGVPSRPHRKLAAGDAQVDGDPPVGLGIGRCDNHP